MAIRSSKASAGPRKRPLAGRPRSRLSAEVGCTLWLSGAFKYSDFQATLKTNLKKKKKDL